MNVKLDNGSFAPERAHPTDAGMDLRTPVEIVVPAHGSTIVDTGVHIQLPANTVGLLQPKSGLNVNHDILSFGVIDEGYTGSIMAKLYNMGGQDLYLEAGSKITQLLVMPVEYVSVDVVDEIDGGVRGNNGFGSTGT